MAPKGLWVGGRDGGGALLALEGVSPLRSDWVTGQGLLSESPPCSVISPRIFSGASSDTFPPPLLPTSQPLVPGQD